MSMAQPSMLATYLYSEPIISERLSQGGTTKTEKQEHMAELEAKVENFREGHRGVNLLIWECDHS
jgi:hypothetical protein